MNNRQLALLSLSLLLALGAGCRSRAKPTKEGSWPEGTSPMTVHPKIDHRVRMANYKTERAEDGRLKILVTIENGSRKDIAVIAYTDWMDKDGNIVERSIDTPIVLPSGTTKLFQDSSGTPEAEYFSVSVRPANTTRRTK